MTDNVTIHGYATNLTNEIGLTEGETRACIENNCRPDVYTAIRMRGFSGGR